MEAMRPRSKPTDPIALERYERIACAMIGIPYEEIVPGSVIATQRAAAIDITATLKGSIQYHLIEGKISI